MPLTATAVLVPSTRAVRQCFENPSNAFLQRNRQPFETAIDTVNNPTDRYDLQSNTTQQRNSTAHAPAHRDRQIAISPSKANSNSTTDPSTMPTAIFHRGNSPNSNKRVAIDPDHISDRTYRQDATQKNEQQSPLQAANNFIKGIIATLHKEYQHTVQKIGEDFSIKFDKISQNRNKLDSMAESNQADGTLTPSRIPKSAQIKFELRTNIQALKESAEFQALEQESKQAIIAYQNAQATILIKVKQQEIGYHQSELHKSLATGLHTLAKGHLVVNGQANVDPHQLVSTVLQRHHQTMLAPLEITPENFQNFYKSTYNLEDLPLPILTPTVDDTTPPAAPILPQEPQALGPFPLAQIEGRRLENIDITDTIVDEQLQISNGGQPLTFEQRMDQMEPMRNALQNRIRQDLANIAAFRQEQLQHPAKMQILPTRAPGIQHSTNQTSSPTSSRPS